MWPGPRGAWAGPAVGGGNRLQPAKLQPGGELGAGRDAASQPEAPREHWVGCLAVLRLPRTMGCLEVPRHLGYPVQSPDGPVP